MSGIRGVFSTFSCLVPFVTQWKSQILETCQIVVKSYKMMEKFLWMLFKFIMTRRKIVSFWQISPNFPPLTRVAEVYWHIFWNYCKYHSDWKIEKFSKIFLVVFGTLEKFITTSTIFLWFSNKLNSYRVLTKMFWNIANNNLLKHISKFFWITRWFKKFI